MSADPPSWLLARQTGRLDRVVGEVAGVWDDAAARAVRLRYLDPHHEEAAQMVAAVQQQEASHRAAEAAVLVVQLEAQHATDAADRCEQRLTDARTQRQTVFEQVAVALRFVSTVYAEARQAEGHARAAMETCAGCPADNGAIAPRVSISLSPQGPPHGG